MHAYGAMNRPGSGSLEAASQAFIATADEVVAIVGPICITCPKSLWDRSRNFSPLRETW